MDSNRCLDCGYQFSSYGNLRKHVLSFHPSKLDEIAPPKRSFKIFNFKCTTCGNNFSALKNLRYHMKNVHKISLEQNNLSLKTCPLCNFTATQNIGMINHFKDIHNISIDLESKEFASFDLFAKWKENIEKMSRSKYVKNNGSKLSRHARYMYYICHRSGNFIPKGKGVRQMKTQGSNKINAFCPANISVITSETGLCKVTFLKTHVGHETLNNALIGNDKLLHSSRHVMACDRNFINSEDNEIYLQERKLALKRRFSSLVNTIINPAELEKLEKSFEFLETEFEVNKSTIQEV